MCLMILFHMVIYRKKKTNLTFQIKIIVTLYVIFTNEMESKLYLTPQVFTFPEKVLCILI